MKHSEIQADPRRILVTGAAGFIGFHLCARLLDQGEEVFGFDNLNDYYDPRLKLDRLSILERNPRFGFLRGDLADRAVLREAFRAFRPDTVVNLAAQAGVRHSLDHPDVYVQSNVTGFFNVLELCREYPARHLVYASSSSVYGNREKTPFSTADDVNRPVSLYAATKVCNEVMAHCYAHLYRIPCTGLRFFTVYGPFGRPDMAYYAFAGKMRRGEPIRLFNHGDMKRDFTYIDDITEGMARLLKHPPKEAPPARIYNIGNSSPEDLGHFVDTLERCLRAEGLLDRPVVREYLPMQPGDVYQTFADVSDLERDFGFRPSTPLEEGLARFARWYREYYEGRE